MTTRKRSRTRSAAVVLIVALVAATCWTEPAAAAATAGGKGKHKHIGGGRRSIQEDSDEGRSIDAVRERIRDLKRRTVEMIKELRSTTERSFNLILQGDEDYVIPSGEAIILSDMAG